MRGTGASKGLLALGVVALLASLGVYIATRQVLAAAAFLALGALALIAALVGRGRRPTVVALPPPPAVVAPPPMEASPAPPLAVVAEPAPAIPAGPSVPIFLPTPGPLFIGREQELDDLVARLRRARGANAIAVVGAAGCGKTTLIGQAVEQHRAEETFPDGISWHVCTDFHGDMGLRRLLIEALDRFGGPMVAMTSTLRIGEAAVADLVRGKRILFWLDDVPQDFPLGRALTTLTARDAQGTGPVLLIASRADWDMPEVSELVLEPPQLDEALDHLRGWMDLAGRSTDFEDYDALKAICTNLGSLPLALRLAAGYAALNGAKLPKLAADLGSVVYPPGDPLRTAERTIAYVERSLFPQPRQIFATLGVFDEPVIDMDAAIAVAVAATGSHAGAVGNDIEAMGLLGLLEADGLPTIPAIRLHPLVRAYAQACLKDLSPMQAARARGARASVLAARRSDHEDDEAIFARPVA